jgi:regulator of replication initiation timing
MQRYINRYAAYADMNARMSSKSRLLISQEAGVDMDAISDWEKDIITSQNRVDPQSLQWLQSPPFNSTIVQLMTMMQSDLKADSGANQFTRGETTGGIVSGKAINSLIQAGGKIASMRTEQLKYGFKEMVEQIIWLMAQFYDKKRTMLITGRTGTRTIEFNPDLMFGKKPKGDVAPPPYTVQTEVSSRDPQRVANQNQMFMEAYQMAAQTPFPIRFSSLLRILNLDGKDRIQPVIEADEHYQEQMQALQQQLAQIQEQMQGMAEENQSLRQKITDTTNTLANVAAKKGSVPPGTPVTNPENPVSAMVNQARDNSVMPSELPT